MPSPVPRPRRIAGATAALVLLLVAGAVVARAPAYVGGTEPVGADSSSHILAADTLARELAAGSPGWWMPELNLGFPLAHFYQPLPHMATALVALALGGPERATIAYKLLVVALLALLPFTTFLGLRRLGLSTVGCVCGAVALATMAAPQKYFGLTPLRYLGGGLYTLLWGAVVAPIALAEGVRFLRGQGNAALAVGAFALVFLSHSLLALGMVPVFVFVTFVARDGGGWRRAFPRLVLLGGVTGICIAFWLLPQLMCSDFFGGWPTERTRERLHGLGLGTVLADWVRGRATDWDGPPVIAWLSIAGAVAAIAGVRRNPLDRVLVFGLVLFVVFTAGRQTFGSFVYWIFPPNARIEGMSRYAALLHLFLAWAAGRGAAWLVDLAGRIPRLNASPVGASLATVVVPLATVGLVFGRYAEDLRGGLATFPEELDRGSYLAAAEALAAQPTEGRVYTDRELGHQSSWAMAYLAVLTGKPMCTSYGVGYQDSLNLYYIQQFAALDPERGPAQARLFNIRYLVHTPNKDVRRIAPESVARQRIWCVSRIPGDYGYFEVVAPPEVVEAAPPVALRPTFLRWMNKEYPRGAPFLRLPDPLRLRFPSLPSATTTGDTAPPKHRARRPRASSDDPPRGAILEERVDDGRYAARASVSADESWLVLKVTPHPFWNATVDGEAVPIYHLSPAFMGLPLERGEHDVVFSFRAPGWQKMLLVLSPLVILGLALHERRARRGRPVARPAEDGA